MQNLLKNHIQASTIVYKPTLLAIGLSSGSHSDGVEFDSSINNGSNYSLDKAIDSDNSTFTGVNSTAAGHTGFDIDLRKPIEADVSISVSPGSADSQIEEYDPTNSYTWFSLDNIYDSSGTSDVISNGLNLNEVFGFTITFNTPTALNRFEITPATSDTIAYTYTVEISFNGTDYITDSTFTMSSVDVAKSVDIQYRSDYDSDDGQQQKGNLENKKIKRLRISSTGNGTNDDIRFSELDLFKLTYEEPTGIYLNKIRARATFEPDVDTGTWIYQVSEDAETYETIGSVNKGAANNEGYDIGFDDFKMDGSPFDRKVKKFRMINTSDAGNERIYDLNIHEYQSITASISDSLVNFDFNDSVLETKAWNSSRYDGRQLQSSGVNVATVDDIGNNDRNPIIQRYSRNIYIGNEVIGCTDVVEDMEEGDLVQFPDYSYIQANSYITVNEDGSITRNVLSAKGTEEERTRQKNGFYKAWYDDFPLGNKCSMILGDPTSKNNLKSDYNIYFNGGQLYRFLAIQRFKHSQAINANSPTILPYKPKSGQYYTAPSASNFDFDNGGAFYMRYNSNITSSVGNALAKQAVGYVYNKELHQSFYSGSLTEYQPVGKYFALKGHEMFSCFKRFFEQKNNSTYKGDKRLFITICSNDRSGSDSSAITNPANFDIGYKDGGNPRPIYTYENGGFATSSVSSSLFEYKQSLDNYNGSFLTKTLADLSTVEIAQVNLRDSSAGGEERVQEFEFARWPNNNVHQAYVSDLYGTGEVYGFPYWVEGRIGQTHEERDLNPGYPELFKRDTNSANSNFGGPIVFSLVSDDVPTLLVDLKKERELPQGKGDKPFVLLPENIDPYIKDNLTLYLTKAGIDISGNASSEVEEITDKKHRRLLDPMNARRRARRRDIDRERLEELRKEFLSQTRRGRRFLRQEDRREEREERRNERRENRQERRNERRENRNDRRENRQDRRRNRRNRRRNR